MVFDIRESYLDALHSVLSAEFPQIAIFGRYAGPSNTQKETDRTEHGQERRWENRTGKRLSTICWVWQDGGEEVRLEYRRAPWNIHASRFLQTKAFDITRHEHLRNLIDHEEWSLKPRFGWVCRLGLVKIIMATSVIVTAVLWGGQETIATIWRMEGHTSGIMALARWGFIAAGAVAVAAVIAVLARGHYFPAGVFRIDEEKDVQRKKERSQDKAIKWIMWALATALLAIGAPPLIDTCSSIDGETTAITEHLKDTHMCEFIRGHTSLLKQW